MGRWLLPEVVQRADLSVFRRISETHHPAGDSILPRLSRAANRSRLWMAIAAGLALLDGRAGRRAGLRGMVALGLASFLANVPAKLAVNRTRPQLQVPVARRLARLPASTSFPSGHSASAVAFATGVSMERTWLAPFLLPLAGAVAYSRVYTGVHYPTDVVVGAALGAGAAMATHRLWSVAPEQPSRTHPGPVLTIHSWGHRLTVVVNPKAGTPLGGAAPEALRRALPDAQVIEPAEGEELREALRRAAENCDVLGVAGGDGSVNAAAEIALEFRKPLLVVPTGTLNRFARAIGIGDVSEAIRAVQHGNATAVDVACIDGMPFLNIASAGAYVALVEARRALEETIGKWPAVLVALIRILRRAEPIVVDVDGRRTEAWLLFFGNCRYRPDGLAPSSRPRLEDGSLDLRSVHASHPFSRWRLVGATLTGTVINSRLYESEVTTGPLHVRSRQGPLPLSRDGEAFEGSSEFTVEKSSSRLVVLVPT